jgi:hypothetical protein
MKKLIVAVLAALYCVPLFAIDNPLIGKWSMSSAQGMMVVAFRENEMTMASSLDLEANPQTVKVRYKKLDKAWGVELLRENGTVEGAMMAILLSDKSIKFGAPGAPFFVLERVE